MSGRAVYGVAAVIVIVFAGFMFASGAQGRTQSGSEVAEKAVRFVQNAYSEQKQYFNLFFTCSAADASCTPSDAPDQVPHSGYAIMSLKHVGEITGNDELVQLADGILARAISQCEEDARYCEWNFFPLHMYYTSTKDQQYRDAMLKVVANVMKERPLKELLDANIPVKWQRLYDVTGENRYRDHLVRIADKELQEQTAQKGLGKAVYTTEEGFTVRSYDLSVIWALYMPAYLATKDEKYLRFAVDFFDQADIEGHTGYFWGNADTGSLIKGIESMTQIAAVPEYADEYTKKAQLALQAVINDRWDTPSRRLFNGDYGFLTGSSGKATNLQGWLIHSFLALSDEEFSTR